MSPIPDTALNSPSDHLEGQFNASGHDMVNELLSGVRLRGLDYRRIEISTPYGLRFGEDQDETRAWFHFIAQGTVQLRTKTGATHVLGCGDAVLLPCAGIHDLYSEDGVALRSVDAFEKARLCDAASEIRACEEGVCRSKDNLIFSCAMEFDLGWLHPLAHLKPEVMHIETVPEHDPQIPAILDVMTAELKAKRPGYGVILTRLADVVAAAILRRWVETGCDVCGWVEAVRDPKLARVLAALHKEPGRSWSVADMASEMGVSRSVFAERFAELTKSTPQHYLTNLRMRLASQWIGRENLSLDEVADRLGYASVAAFSRAFKRTTGISPGAVRSSQS
ncbi:AraC family transcriptional regulator [Thalassospira indica]|uniref:AraC family transcriptional regulator n=1 Tax=Thalassospira indica TaxID=1891279 RepID=A0ABN5NFT8_9PROT|nr:AraC family transcriptional regulator [Thalassospira indica]AXO15241.1 AraC family transcriptional regulator [Thalassospira indica]OAZ08703.1 AraC family transcriptional regulator [Thalassospira profundimaris]